VSRGERKRAGRQNRSDRLDRARREAEARLRDLRLSLRREWGAAPSRKGLWWLIAAGAVGLALAVGTSTAVRRRRKSLPGPRL
jgi:hypothetical protein